MQKIQTIISETIQSLYGGECSPQISPAPKPELGEYCINIFPLAKTAGKAPNLISEEVANALLKYPNIFVSTSATGGYVNFFLTDEVWMELFSHLNQETKNPNNQKTIIVDYIGANVGKPLHIGHICTPSIGQVVCNVYRHLGYRVIGDSHFGDWGGIFGKLIWGWKYLNPNQIISSEWAEKYEFLDSLDLNREEWLSKLLNNEGVNLLLRLYQQFLIIHSEDISEHVVREGQSRLEFQYLSGIGIDLSNPEERKHHEENVELWKRFTAISITETEKKLDLLNVHATYNIGESFYEGLGLPRPNGENYPDLEYTMKDIVRELIEKGVATQNEDGSVGVVFPEEMKMPSCILQKKDGTGLYLTSDLAAIKYRLTNGWNPEKIIYSVDVRQQLHLKQAFWIAKKAWGDLGVDEVEIFHAYNGFIKLKEGAMSTRHGTVIFLEALIDEGNERTAKILEEKGRVGEKALSPEDIQAITVGAIKYSYLAQDREKDVTFDWDKALNFEGNSGPYIQYAYVRAQKIIEGQEIGNITSLDRLSSYDKDLIRALARWDEVIDTTAKSYKPHHLALYSYDLAGVFNSFYVHTPKILEEKDPGLRALRLSLVRKFSETVSLGFSLLGIQMPSEM